MTETKFKQSEHAKYKQEWGSGMLVSCTPEIRGQAGVAILFRKGGREGIKYYKGVNLHPVSGTIAKYGKRNIVSAKKYKIDQCEL